MGVPDFGAVSVSLIFQNQNFAASSTHPILLNGIEFGHVQHTKPL